MSLITLVLPGNTFHANHLSGAIEKMDAERCGLSSFRKWNIPATAFIQGLDLLMKPWLEEEMRIPGSIEWGNAPFSHSFLPLVRGSWRYELDEERMVCGSVPVTFFSEFYPPDASHIPTEFTLILPGSSALYEWKRKSGDIRTQEFPPEVEAIRFDGKVGILIHEEWFKPVLDSFFFFQRYPIAGSAPNGRDALVELISAIREVSEGPENRTVVIPIDLEAPWIGSCFGSHIWGILFAEVRRQKLDWVFTPLSTHLERFARDAKETFPPHRELLKWSTWDVQIRHILHVDRLKPRNQHEIYIKMIATGSDIFAAWDRMIQESRGRIISKEARDQDGEPLVIPITYNQGVIDVELAAYRALKRGRSFLSELEDLNQGGDYFTRVAVSMASELSL